MDIIQALILGIVEGISEFLPISSTGHLILASDILRISQNEFVKSFEIIIQLGAILAVLSLYWKKVFSNLNLWPKLFLAFLPSGIIGLTLYKLIKSFLLGNSFIVVIALLLGGILLIILEKIYKEKDHNISEIEKVSNKQAFLIGICQSISIIPGVSRSASTIIGGMFLGLKRQTAVELSFLLAIPTMIAATGLDLIKSSFRYTNYEYLLLCIGLIASFITSLFAIKFLLKFVQTHNFIVFGVYRILLAIIFFLYI